MTGRHLFLFAAMASSKYPPNKKPWGVPSFSDHILIVRDKETGLQEVTCFQRNNISRTMKQNFPITKKPKTQTNKNRNNKKP